MARKTASQKTGLIDHHGVPRGVGTGIALRMPARRRPVSAIHAALPKRPNLLATPAW
jgi:hypothetical protein